MPKIRVLEVSGSPYEMGYQHGIAYQQEIQTITAERLHLSTQPAWTGRSLSRAQVIALAEDCLPHHYAYAPQEMEELEGMAVATGLSVAELLITNGYTDFMDYIYSFGAERDPLPQPECTAFLVPPQAGNDGFLAQTWDMHASAAPYVILLQGRPQNAPAFYTFTITGCVGMIGMNEAGIAVGINNLLGADGQAGVTWTFVCRKILRQTSLEAALACITEAKLAGGHNYLLMDSNGRGYNVEAMASTYHITELKNEPLIHANQCLYPATRAHQRPLTEALVRDSTLRADRVQALLTSPTMITPEYLQSVLRDRDGEFKICATNIWEGETWETCCAAIMRPGNRALWGVWGLPIHNEFEHFVL